MRSSRSRGSEKAECCTAKQTSHVWCSVETYGPQMFHGVIGKLQGVHMLRSATVGLLTSRLSLQPHLHIRQAKAGQDSSLQCLHRGRSFFQTVQLTVLPNTIIADATRLDTFLNVGRRCEHLHLRCRACNQKGFYCLLDMFFCPDMLA